MEIKPRSLLEARIMELSLIHEIEDLLNSVDDYNYFPFVLKMKRSRLEYIREYIDRHKYPESLHHTGESRTHQPDDT